MAHVLKPARGMVLLEPQPQPSVQNGIFIPVQADGELKSQYVVRAVGKGRVIRTKKKRRWLMQFPEVRVNDVVVANRYAGDAIEINGKVHRLVHQDSILAIVGIADSDPRLEPEPASNQPAPLFGGS